MTLVCSKCREEKPDDEFNRSSKNINNGYRQSYCKLCTSVHGKKRYQERSVAKCAYQRERSRLYDCTPKGKFNAYRQGARIRGYEFLVTVEDVARITSLPCSYCGVEGESGMDRVDNSQGYRPGNILPCCAVCNRMKLDHSVDDFHNHIIKILLHRDRLRQEFTRDMVQEKLR